MAEQPVVLILVAAALLDFLIGDPWGWLHPVQAMGWVIQGYCSWAFKVCQTPRAEKLAGIGLGLGLVLGSGAIAALLLWGAYTLSPWLGMGLEVVLLASCFAGRSLRRAAEDVLKSLMAGDELMARSRLRLYVGRDTEDLTAPEMLRAILETVSENATDGVFAPLFYAILGYTLTHWSSLTIDAGVPLALAYKAASTLDSMVGYRRAPYTHLGGFSARLEDTLTWLPCRLSVVTLGAISGRIAHVLHLCRRDASKDPSPNAGWSECAYAAILDVQLGGLNTYKGIPTLKPKLGNPHRPITPERIHLALRLTRNGFLLWLLIALAILGEPT
nr:adenosylcobinamide-phosphate synthase CbiB [Petrachloros mirabilis]